MFYRYVHCAQCKNVYDQYVMKTCFMLIITYLNIIKSELHFHLFSSSQFNVILVQMTHMFNSIQL